MPREAWNRGSERGGFLLGVNVPWFSHDSYGCDIGANAWRTESRFDPPLVERVFRNCRAIGFRCVRIWLFEIMEGIRFDKDGFALGFDDHFLRNLNTLLDIAEREGVTLLVTFQPHISFCMKFPDEYRHYTRILHEPEATAGFVERCVVPLARLLAARPNLLLLDVYAEPEGDVTGPDGNRQPYGYGWDTMRHYLRSVATVLKANAPGLPVTVASGWRKYDSLKEGRYNGLGFDAIGVDIYDDAGEVEPAGSLGTEGVPVWLAEFGPETKDDWDDEAYSRNTMAFYENARKNGYFGAFLWMYGYALSGESLSLVGKDGRVRPVADRIHALAVRMDAQEGIAPMPDLLSVESPDSIEWFPVPGAVSYALERTEDLRTWTEVSRTAVEDPDGIRRLRGSAAGPAEGRTCWFRVAATLADGRVSMSRISNAVPHQDERK